MRRWGPLILGAVVLAFMLAITLVFQDVVRDVILVPILHMGWLLWNFFLSISQGTLWVFFLTIFLLILAVGLRRPKANAFPVAEASKIRPVEHGRVYYWARQVNMMAVEGYSRVYALLELRKLVLAQLAFRERLTRKQVEQRIEAQALELPPEILGLIHLDEKGSDAHSHFLVEWAWRIYRSVFRRNRTVLPIQLRRDLEGMIAFLEEHQP